MTTRNPLQTASAQHASAAGRSSAPGGTGAPPSNTAPPKDSNSNPPVIEVLHQGIDSLYLSVPGALKEDQELILHALKGNAQEYNTITSANCIYLHKHLTFAVRDKGIGRFSFVLVNEHYNIRLSSSRSKQLPLATIQIASRYLLEKGVSHISEEIAGLMSQLGDVEGDIRISRFDLCADFVAQDDLFAYTQDAWVGRARNFHQHWSTRGCTGWSIALGGALSCRVYDKTEEIDVVSKKFYMHDIWVKAGWLGELPVYRLEFQFRREVLKEFGLSILDDLPGFLGKLWRYATTEWLRLCIPDSGSKRSRWDTHPAWSALSCLEWYEDDLQPLERLRRTHSDTEAWAIRNFGASIVNFMAHYKLESPYEAIDKLLDAFLETCQKEARFGEKTTLNVVEDRARKKASHWGRPYPAAVRASRKIADQMTTAKYRKLKS